ncbi:hypothetical protein NG726_17750 [Pseudomonas sp. MOB-449]|nr:hypothetical protein [Pseudomonas sp. MOB-449]
MNHTPFDPQAEAARLRNSTRARRKTTFRRSRLDRYAGELLALRRAGATIAELQRWLGERRVRVVHTTVARWLSRQIVVEGPHG